MICLYFPTAIASFYRRQDGTYSLCALFGRYDNLGETETLRLAKVACHALDRHLRKMRVTSP